MTADRFDPKRKRDFLLSSSGLERELRDTFQESRAVGGVGSTAAARLNTAIECFLVGFDEPAERLLRMALEWVQFAIDTGEKSQRYFPGATEASYFHTRAYCNWLLYNRHDAESLQQEIENEDRRFILDRRRDKVDVSFTLPSYVNAGAFERALEIFDSTPSLTPPTSLVARNEAQMAYILCRHYLGLQYTQSDVETATAKFLKRNIDSWLSRGHWERAAEWLKIVHWNPTDRTIPAKHILMKSYDYLTGRQPPS